MEVFHMDKYEMYEVEKAIRAYSANKPHERPSNWRSENRQWDYIICTVCTGCGKPLSRYENHKGLAFCFSCREILFPETVTLDKSRRQRFPYPRSGGQFL